MVVVREGLEEMVNLLLAHLTNTETLMVLKEMRCPSPSTMAITTLLSFFRRIDLE